MNRCKPFFFPSVSLAPHRHRLAWALSAVLALAGAPAAAQVQPGLGMVRNFPDAALRGHLTLTTTSDALLNSKPLRMAPGMRLFSPQNTLVMAHSVLGQSFKVNYLIEPSTGMLHAAWILTEDEAAQPRKGSDFVLRNFRAESDPVQK